MRRRLYENDDIDVRKLEWIDTVPLDDLFDELRDITGLRDLEFTYDIKKIRWDTYINIESNNLVNKVGFLKLMFKNLFIRSDLKVIEGDPDKNEPEFWIWGTIDFRYSHPSMGSNGYTFLRCWYDDDKGWTFREW